MQVLVSPEALKLMNQTSSTEQTNFAISEAIRHDLDRLRQKEYFFCTHKGAKFAITKFDGTPLALYFSSTEKKAILFHRQENGGTWKQDFFDALEPLCTELRTV